VLLHIANKDQKLKIKKLIMSNDWPILKLNLKFFKLNKTKRFVNNYKNNLTKVITTLKQNNNKKDM